MKITKEELNQAEKMLEAFVAAGASHFTIVICDEDENVIINRKFVDFEVASLNLRNDLSLAYSKKASVHVRPYSSQNTLIQLDDCLALYNLFFRVSGSGQDAVLENVKPFLITETSVNNFQAWISVRAKIKDTICKQLKKIFKSDPGATGSCRLASSFNFKKKHEPNYPQIKLIHYDFDAIVEPENLLIFELFDNKPSPEPDTREKKIIRRSADLSPGRSSKNSPIPWPFYDNALKLAGLNYDLTGPDRSVADYMWSKLCLKWGHDVDSVIEKLVKVSSKAKSKSYSEALYYATNTVLSAARANEQT